MTVKLRAGLWQEALAEAHAGLLKATTRLSAARRREGGARGGGGGGGGGASPAKLDGPSLAPEAALADVAAAVAMYGSPAGFRGGGTSAAVTSAAAAVRAALQPVVTVFGWMLGMVCVDGGLSRLCSKPADGLIAWFYCVGRATVVSFYTVP